MSSSEMWANGFMEWAAASLATPSAAAAGPSRVSQGLWQNSYSPVLLPFLMFMGKEEIA